MTSEKSRQIWGFGQKLTAAKNFYHPKKHSGLRLPIEAIGNRINVRVPPPIKRTEPKSTTCRVHNTTRRHGILSKGTSEDATRWVPLV